MIKSTIIICSVCCFFSIESMAQNITITNVSEKLGGSYNAAIQISIPHTNTKMVERKWNSFLKDYHAKVKSSKDEITGLNFVLKAKDTLNVFSRIVENSEGVLLTAAFSRNGIFITSTTDQNDYNRLSKEMHDLALPIAKDGLDKKIEAASVILDDKTKEHDNLMKRNEHLKDDNKKLKSKISDNEREIDDNDKKIGGLKAALEQQKSAVDEIKSKKKDLE